MSDDPTLEQLLQGSSCDILLNLKEISDVCGSMIDKLHGIESQLFDLNRNPVSPEGTSPNYNKWVRLSALYQLIFRSIAAHGASEDDILMLALGIQMKRQQNLSEQAESIFNQAVAEAEEEAMMADPEPKSRKKKVH